MTLSNRVGIRTCSDYSPFGVELDGRTVSGGYRYGFGGFEKDNELKGEGNSYTTLFREYDPRLGRWLSLDPKMAKYPNQSPYVAFNNNPIFFTDPYGDDPPEGFKTIAGKGGDVSVPQSTTSKNYTSDGGTYCAGDLESFTIGSKTFSAQYDKAGAFTGYFNGSDKYVNPDISLSSGGITGINLDVTFTVTGVPADGLQVVQTVHKTGMDAPFQSTTVNGVTFDANGMVPGSYLYKNGTTDMQGNVDGAAGSVYAFSINKATGKPNGESFPGMPYYYSASEASTTVTWSKNTGTIRVIDAPNVQNMTQSASWTSMIVATNYMGTGKDVVLGTFRWGWTSKGATPIHTGVDIIGNTPSATELNTINKFYGTYQFFK